MAQYVDVKGFGLAEFPDGISRETMLQALQRRFSQMPTNGSGATVAPYTPSLSERAASGVSNVLQRTGLVSDRYGANRIGGNVEAALNFLPVIGDAIGGDDLGRAIAQGDAGDIGFAALGVIPIAGDAVKGLKVFRGQPAGAPLRVNDDGLLWVTPDRNYAADPHYGGKQGAEVLEGVIPEANVFDYSIPGSREFLIAEAKKRGVSRPLARDAASGNFRALKDKEITSIIKDAGFDGFKAVEPEGQSSIALFDTGKFQINPQQNPLTQVGDAGKGARKIKLFHGTNANFDDFDTSKIGSASDPGIRGRGFYFTPNKKTAESYGDKIKEVEVEVENPLDLQQFSSAKEVSEYLGVPENIIRFRVDKLPSGEFKSVSVSPNYTGSFTSAIKDKGHDAVIHGQEVVIFNPDKIKTLKTYDK